MNLTISAKGNMKTGKICRTIYSGPSTLSKDSNKIFVAEVFREIHPCAGYGSIPVIFFWKQVKLIVLDRESIEDIYLA